MQKVTSPTRAASEMKTTYSEMRKLVINLLKVAGVIIVPKIWRCAVRRRRYKLVRHLPWR